MTEDQNTRAPVVSSQAGEEALAGPNYIDEICGPAPGGMALADELKRIIIAQTFNLSSADKNVLWKIVETLRTAAQSAVRGWQPIETAPQDGDFYFYGLNVKHANGSEWFEAYFLHRDEEGQMLEANGDVFSAWGHDDFEVWAPAPSRKQEGSGEPNSL
jgi:hypothetical protein